MCYVDDKAKDLLLAKIESLKQKKQAIEQRKKRIFLKLKQERIRQVLGEVLLPYEEMLRIILLRLSCRLKEDN